MEGEEEKQEKPMEEDEALFMRRLKDKLYAILRNVDFEVGPKGNTHPPPLTKSSSQTPSPRTLSILLNALVAPVMQVTTEKGIRKMLAEELAVPSVEEHKGYIRQHVAHILEHMDERESIEPLDDDAGQAEEQLQQQQEKGKEEEEEEPPSTAAKRVLVIGAGTSGLAAASALIQIAGAEVLVLEAHDLRTASASPELLLMPSGGAAAAGQSLMEALAGQLGWELRPVDQLGEPMLLRPGGAQEGEETCSEARRLGRQFWLCFVQL
jgi:hypothetical protein